MMRTLDKDEIMEKLEHILENRFGICAEKACEDYQTVFLTGERFRLEARDLLYLFFEAEKEFKINIIQEAILTQEFSSLNGIAQIIEKHMMMKAVV